MFLEACCNEAPMDFHSYTTMRDWTRRADPDNRPAQDIDQFYRRAMLDAQKMGSGQFFGQMLNERDWEKARRPYYNMWPSIIPMLTRLNLDLDSDLIQLPLPALCIRFPKDPAKNPLKFEWKGKDFPVRCIMLGEINDGTGLSVLVDIGEVMGGVGVPIYTYRNFPRRPGLTVEQSIDGLGKVGLFSEFGVQVPDSFVMDCIRLCCSLCLLENDPSIISPMSWPTTGPSSRPAAIEIYRQGPSPGKSRMGRGKAYRSHPALSSPAHDVGVDGPGSGGGSDRPQEGQHRASGGRGEIAEWVWGSVNMTFVCQHPKLSPRKRKTPDARFQIARSEIDVCPWPLSA